MKVLILGGNGMLGHELMCELSKSHDVRVTLRDGVSGNNELFPKESTYSGVDLCTTDRLIPILADFRPEVIINAAGIVKQRKEGQDALPNLEINSLLPHRLANICRAMGARLFHISTDCVFSGERGHYAEVDRPSPVDTYGYAKLLGEVTGDGIITLRTSIIGLELKRKGGLVEWFLSEKDEVEGYRRAIFSGLTTMELSRIIRRLIENYPGASGLYHLGGDSISKYDLLVMIRDRVRPGLSIVPNDDFHCDRSLDASEFLRDFAYTPPDWHSMVEELCDRIKLREQK